MSAIFRLVLGILAFSVSWTFGDDSDVEYSKTKLDAFIDAGQIKSGTLDGDEKIKDWQVLQRTKISLTQSATINDNLKLTGAVGGLFFYSLPVTEAPHTRITKFTPVVEEASGIYSIGDPEEPFAKLRFGLFYMKYNGDSKNLGEYLYRSSTYPQIVRTGGWYFLGSGYVGQGVHLNLNFLENSVFTDFTIFMERDLEPTYDLTPTFLAGYRLGSMLQIQAGISFNHLIPAVPSKTTPESREAAYFTGMDTLTVLDSTGSRAEVVLDGNGNPIEVNQARLIYSTIDLNAEGDAQNIKDAQLGYYSFKGIKMMARASFAPFGNGESDLFAANDLKIYAEMGLLGWKNYPVFYENRMKRMPIMLGINIPTFRFLDVLSFEFEYWDHEFPNDEFKLWDQTLPIPGGIGSVSSRQAFVQNPTAYIDTKDNIKWSIFAEKTLSTGLALNIQVANDHLRVMDFNNKMTYQPVTRNGGDFFGGDWWYLIRLKFAI